MNTEPSEEELFETRHRDLCKLVEDEPPCAGPVDPLVVLKWFDEAERKLKGATPLFHYGFRVLPIDLLLTKVAENMPDQPDGKRIAWYWLRCFIDINMAVERVVQVKDCFGTYLASGVGIVESEYQFPENAATLPYDDYTRLYTFDEAVDCLRAEKGSCGGFRIPRFFSCIPADKHLQEMNYIQRMQDTLVIWEIIQYLTCQIYLDHFGWQKSTLGMLMPDGVIAQWGTVEKWVLYSLLCQKLDWPLDSVPPEITGCWEYAFSVLCDDDAFSVFPMFGPKVSAVNVSLGAQFFKTFSKLRARLDTCYISISK